MKGKTFCRQCGKTDEKLIKSLCPSCFIEEAQIISIPDELEVTICTRCGSIQTKGRWNDSNLSPEEIVIQTLLEEVEASEDSFDLKISPEILNIRGSTYECLIGIETRVLGKTVYQEYPVKVKLDKTVCPECSKYASGYYEAVIQIRADKRPLTAQEIENADKIIKKGINRLWEKNRMAYISQKLEIKEGVDYYVGSYKAARRLTEDLKNMLGGVVKESPRLMGRDKSRGKDLYRIWISLRLPHFHEGDFVSYRGLKAQVLFLQGQKIGIRNLKSAHTSTVSWRDYEKIKTIARKEDVKQAMITAKTPYSLQILHPDTYQPVELDLDSHLSRYEIGEELPVVEIEGTLYPLE